MVHKWKIVLVESLVFLVLSSFHNYKFLEDWTKIHWFINNSKFTIARRHPHDWCGKKIAQNGIAMREKWMVILAIQCDSTQNHRKINIFQQKKFTIILHCCQPLLHFGYLVQVHPSPMFLYFVAWANNKILKSRSC
jgi:hypothetical protein